MLRLVLASACILAASPVVAAHKTKVDQTPSGQMGWTQSDKANYNACFGQARAYYSEMLGNDGDPSTSNGAVISERAKAGENRSNNEQFIADYCQLQETE